MYHRSRLVFLLVALASTAAAHDDHGGHGQKPIVDEHANWMTRHMAEEHHISNFDDASFFALHDYDADGSWEAQEILRTYGLMDESNKDVTPARRDEIVREVMDMFDTDKDGVITKAEFASTIQWGKTLPDFGHGPGHHGDDEYEYEIHHWEKYHDENTKLEDLTHPEDIEHFKKHEQMEEEQERIENMEKESIVLENVPEKFRRQT